MITGHLCKSLEIKSLFTGKLLSALIHSRALLEAQDPTFQPEIMANAAISEGVMMLLLSKKYEK